MRRCLVIILICLTAFILCGCCLFHDWQDATCTTPKTCAKCGKTEGEPLGHKWIDASCTEPKTCTRCGETEGEPLGHKWIEASCNEPKTCTVCGETKGEALGHRWAEANCQSPKICTRCGAQEGGLGEHAWKEATCLEPKTCSVCGETEGEPLGHEWKEATYVLPQHCERCGEKVGERVKLTGRELVNELKKRGYKTTTIRDPWGNHLAVVLSDSKDPLLLALENSHRKIPANPQVLSVDEWVNLQGNRVEDENTTSSLTGEEQRKEIIDFAVCIAEILGDSLSPTDFVINRKDVIPKWIAETDGAKYKVDSSSIVLDIKD